MIDMSKAKKNVENIYLVGEMKEVISGHKLPSNRQVLSAFFLQSFTKESYNTSECNKGDRGR